MGGHYEREVFTKCIPRAQHFRAYSQNDGLLLYNWNLNDVSFMGKIETSYANNVKIAGNIIFAATEDGIEIIQIKY